MRLHQNQGSFHDYFCMFFLLVLFQVMCYTELKLICWVYLSETEEEHLRKANTMADPRKYNLILDSLQKLLENKKLQTISVSEIAQTAGIGKGSIYYYFPSKDAILEALVERNYEKPLKTAQNLSSQTEISPFTRMAMIFEACRSSSNEFVKSEDNSGTGAQEKVADKGRVLLLQSGHPARNPVDGHIAHLAATFIILI